MYILIAMANDSTNKATLFMIASFLHNFSQGKSSQTQHMTEDDVKREHIKTGKCWLGLCRKISISTHNISSLFYASTCNIKNT